MTYSIKDINEKALYIIREDSNGVFSTEYLPIPINESLLKNRENLLRNIKISPTDKEEDYNAKIRLVNNYWKNLQDNHSYLLDYRSYTSFITSSYVPLVGMRNDFEMKFIPFSDDLREVRIEKDGSTDDVGIDKVFSESFFNSYFIEQAYEQCEKNNVKAYSHRRIGRNQFNFKLNNIFSIGIYTNFGYGIRNEFSVDLKFDEIQIFPYSRFVMYSDMSFKNVLWNTWAFFVDEDSWESAFDLVRDACNVFQQEGQNSFIKRYFTDELEVLTQKLREYLSVSDFEFSGKDGYPIRKEKNIKIKLDGFPLIIFRGKKIAGATNFVNNIKKINKILPTQRYVDIIIDCCEKVFPQLNNAIVELNQIIGRLEDNHRRELEKQDQFQERLTEIKLQKEIYDNSEKVIKDKIFELTKDESIDYNKKIIMINEMMLIKHPDWTKIKQDFDNSWKKLEEQKSKCSEIYSNIRSNKFHLDRVSECQEEIGVFLENK